LCIARWGKQYLGHELTVQHGRCDRLLPGAKQTPRGQGPPAGHDPWQKLKFPRAPKSVAVWASYRVQLGV
jgi:hypothetical protein